MRDAARPVAKTRRLYDHVDRRDDHVADGLRGQRKTAHRDHRLKTTQRLARRVGVQRAHRAVVARVHGLQQIESLGSAHFADDDAFRAHTQAVLHQFAHGHGALTFEVGRPRLQPHNVVLLQLQFRRVFTGDDAFVVFDVVGETIEQRRFSRARAAGDQHIAAHAADDLEHLGALGRYRAETLQLIESELVLLKLTNRQRRPVNRQRRRDHVDARAVEQTRVADRRRVVDAATHLADDALTDVHQLRIIPEANVGELNLTADLDVGFRRAVHHDVGDVITAEQRLQRTITEHVVANIVEQLLLLGNRHHDILDRDDLVHDVANFFARVFRVELG